ncbi:MAG: FkbM family methyltransferase [Verrucomicrobia bacterium]|nr:FkbM family methyltransferase [Verrucomicrobiota bacterium]
MIPSILRKYILHHRKRHALRKILNFLTKQNKPLPICIYDIGARWGISHPYDALNIYPEFISVGFEPDPKEAAQLRNKNAFSKVCETALGRTNENRTLYIAKEPGSSSIFIPNPIEIGRHTDWDGYRTVNQLPITVHPLDEVIVNQNLPIPNYIKIDCEGAEGEILEGAQSTMKNITGLTFEARWRDFYNGGATLPHLVENLMNQGLICLKMDQIGSYFGSVMMFDVSMVRHPETIRSEQEFFYTIIFALLHDNWQFARHVAQTCRFASNHKIINQVFRIKNNTQCQYGA